MQGAPAARAVLRSVMESPIITAGPAAAIRAPHRGRCAGRAWYRACAPRHRRRRTIPSSPSSGSSRSVSSCGLLVRTRQPRAARLQRRQRFRHAGKQPGAVGDMGAVMGQEDLHQRRHLVLGHRRAAGLHRLGDQGAGAEPHHVAQAGQVQQRPAPGRQHGIGRAQKVGRGVGQGAVQVEDQGRGQGMAYRLAEFAAESGQYTVANRHFAFFPPGTTEPHVESCHHPCRGPGHADEVGAAQGAAQGGGAAACWAMSSRRCAARAWSASWW